MRAWKRRAFQLGWWLRNADVEGSGLTFVEIHRRTGHSRSSLRGDLAWLEAIGILASTVDESKRRRWGSVPREEVIDQPPAFIPPDDLLDLSRTQELLNELG
jgi:hypothetical protein